MLCAVLVEDVRIDMFLSRQATRLKEVAVDGAINQLARFYGVWPHSAPLEEHFLLFGRRCLVRSAFRPRIFGSRAASTSSAGGSRARWE